MLLLVHLDRGDRDPAVIRIQRSAVEKLVVLFRNPAEINIVFIGNFDLDDSGSIEGLIRVCLNAFYCLSSRLRGEVIAQHSAATLMVRLLCSQGHSWN